MHPSGGPRANVWRPSRCIAPAVPPRRQTYPQKRCRSPRQGLTASARGDSACAALNRGARVALDAWVDLAPRAAISLARACVRPSTAAAGLRHSIEPPGELFPIARALQRLGCRAPAQIPRLGCRRSLQSSGAPRLAAGLTVPGQGGGAASEAGSGGCSVLYLWRERRPQRRAAARRGGSGGGARCGGDGRHSTHRGVHAPRCWYLLCYHSTSAALKQASAL